MSEPELRIVFERPEDSIEAVLTACQAAIASHPIAARAIFGALVAEGRGFAQTPEGAEWKERLEHSDLVERARMIWETLSMTAVSAAAPEALPSACVDAVVRASAIDGLEPLLSDLMLRLER